jgi:hypothetical protein
MGMFDEIRVEQILPDRTEQSSTWYQTKSLDCHLDKYVITANGELYRECWNHEWVEEPDHFLNGYIRKVEGTYRRDYLTDFHGDIIFYSSKPELNTNRIWRDYHARFTEGKLSRIWFEDKKY